MPPKRKTPKPGFTRCPDCGGDYKIGAPHQMFCAAHTCEDCGSSFPDVIPADSAGRRVCIRCQDEEDAE